AFYTVFSLVPLFIFTLTLVAHLLGQRPAADQVLHEIHIVLGGPLGDVLARMIEEVPNPATSPLAAAVGSAALLFRAFRTFGELEAALNTINRVKLKKKHGVWTALQKRFLSLHTILGGLLFLVISMLGPLTFRMLTNWITETLWGGPTLWHVVHGVVG